MEQYGISRALGFDTEAVFAEGANLFARTKRANAEFTASFGEQLPYEADSVDAIIAVDVFEHVRNLSLCMSECSRVLRKGGHLLAIFPPFLNPIAHHLKVSNTPFLHWLFSGDTLRKMQNNIVVSQYGDAAKHYIIHALDGYRLPYVNGVSVRSFWRLVRNGPWQVVLDRRRGFPCMGEVARSSTFARAISRVMTPLAHVPWLSEIALDHVAVILQKV
jgi:SAM-dependent methyltransferase